MNLTQIGLSVMQKRVLLTRSDGKQETPDEALRRVAHHIAQAKRQYGASEEEVAAAAQRYYDLMDRQDFMPNSPAFTGAGTALGQLSACFVLPVGDSLPEIYGTMTNAALTHKSGGGTGFAFSRLRPAGDLVSSSHGVASGPVSFMRVYNASTEAIKQGGTRRGANMGILRVDHPDILDFLESKADTTQITNFNISVALTDSFMAALEAGTDYELINPRNGKVTGTLSAQMVWDKLVENAWTTGEPGVIFIDRINRRNPNGNGRTYLYVDGQGRFISQNGEVKEGIEATNP